MPFGPENFPHAGGCEYCREEGICNWCGTPTTPSTGKCTNGRCAGCHAQHCTLGGDTYPGHGYGSSPTKASEGQHHQADKEDKST